jgi:hypothetical protein
MRQLSESEIRLYLDPESDFEQWIRDGIPWYEGTVKEFVEQDVRCECTDGVFKAFATSWADRKVVAAIAEYDSVGHGELGKYVQSMIYLEALESEEEEDGEEIEAHLQDVDAWVRYDGLQEINGTKYFVFEDE